MQKIFDKSKMDYNEFKIPKKGGKLRNVVAPNKELLKFQRSVLRTLNSFYFKQVEGTEIQDIAHGFLKGRNVITAAEQHIGYKVTIMMDISNFFDTVYSTMLPEEFATIPQLFHKDGYCAQGFATSPLLANISSIQMLQRISRYLKRFDDYAFTIYADDIQISVNIEDYDVLNRIISEVSKDIEAAGFKVNEKKTRIKYAKFGWRRILGVNVGDKEVRATRKVIRKIRAARQQRNGPSLGGLMNWASCQKPKYRK